DPEAPEESKNACRSKSSARVPQVVHCLGSSAHPSGSGGFHHLCSLASCECAVLGKFMGLGPAAAAVQSLWRLWAWSPTGFLGLSSMGTDSFSPPEATSREGAAPGLLPRSAGHAAQGCHDQDRGDGRCER